MQPRDACNFKNNLHKSNSHRKQIFPRSTSKVFQIFSHNNLVSNIKFYFSLKSQEGWSRLMGNCLPSGHSEIQVPSAHCPASLGRATGPICIAQARSFSCYYPEGRWKSHRQGKAVCQVRCNKKDICVYKCVYVCHSYLHPLGSVAT